MMQSMLHLRWVLLVLCVAFWRPIFAQEQAQESTQGEVKNLLANGNMEEWDESGSVKGWRFLPKGIESGYSIKRLEQSARQGKFGVVLDASAIPESSQMFGNLSQSFDATAYQGKRLRFRGAVRTSDRASNGQAQLWLRVDLQRSGQMGAFDNMQDRPIKCDDWEYFEIVADVAKDAKTFTVGALIIGQCRVELDDFTLEVLSNSEAAPNPTTVQSTQPFWNLWLALPFVAITLMVVSQCQDRSFGRFAFYFTATYMFLYFLDDAMASYMPGFGFWLVNAFRSCKEPIVLWLGGWVLNNKQLSTNGLGSGDTTYGYMCLLLYFLIACIVALAGMGIDRRRSPLSLERDLLRSFLRYSVAIILLIYGYLKVVNLFNQFPPLNEMRLEQSYGSSSPMGLVWTFMGASRPYTIFAGAGEIAAGCLLLWRRTALLGSLVGCAVMSNVVLLNFCYDIPVKIHSCHLLIGCLLVALPDAGALWNFFIAHRPMEPRPLQPPYAHGFWKGIYWGVKLLLLMVGVGFTSFGYLTGEWRFQNSGIAKILGEWKVDSHSVDGQNASEDQKWQEVQITLDFSAQVGERVDLRVTTAARGNSTEAYRWQRETSQLIALNDAANAPAMLQVERISGKLKLTFGKQQVELHSVHEDYLLTNRGFRWVDERPYNR